MLWDDEQDKELLEYYKALIKLRKEHSAIRSGDFSIIKTDDENGVLGFKRFDENEEIDVFVTNGSMADVPYSIKVFKTRRI